MTNAITKLWFYPFCRLMTRKIMGIENISDKETFIIVSNHEKLIDPVFLIYAVLKKLNKKVHFLSTGRWWFLGETICKQWAGCIPVFDSKQAYEDTKRIIKSGGIVGIFPEGRLTNKKRTFKTGAVRLAIETRTPILPIGVKSSYFPFGAAVNIGKPIYLKKGKDIGNQTAQLMELVYRLKSKIN